MIDFPNSPAIGQTFNPGTGPIYIWDGVGWNLATSQTRTAQQNNLLVNPAMQVSQENGTNSVTGTGSFPVDMWAISNIGPVTSGQQVALRTPGGSPNRVRKTVTTPKASLAAGDHSNTQTTVEGLRLAVLGYGGADAMQSVLRFGYKGPAGTYSLAVLQGGSTRSYVKNFTISAAQAGTDTVQTFVIPGDTTGAWATDNTRAMSIYIFDAVGTTFQGVEGWQAGTFFGTAANTNQVATNGTVTEVFDVGLYPDPEKTGLPPPFIAPSFAQALFDCQRYWTVLPTCYLTGYHSSGNGIFETYSLPTSMRTSPTVAFYNLANISNVTTLVANSASPSSITASVTISTGPGGGIITFGATANARM